MEANPSNPPNKPTLLRTIKILWFALLFTLVIYAFVGYMTKDQMATNPDPDFLKLFAVILGFVAASITMVIIFLGRFWKTREIPQYYSLSIIRFALAESIAIYGLVLYFLGASWVVFAIFWAWSFCIFLFLVPTEAGLDRFLGTKEIKPL